MTNETNYDDKLRGFYTGDHWVKPDTSRENGLYNGHYVHSGHIHDWVEQHSFTRVYTGQGFEIWHKPATTNWVAIHTPREYEPAMYIVVEPTNKTIGKYVCYQTLEVKWATKKHAQVLKALIAEYERDEQTEVEEDHSVETVTLDQLKFTLAYLKTERKAQAAPEARLTNEPESYEAQDARVSLMDDLIHDIELKIKAIGE